jgi:hypothetical protein
MGVDQFIEDSPPLLGLRAMRFGGLFNPMTLTAASGPYEIALDWRPGRRSE